MSKRNCHRRQWMACGTLLCASLALWGCSARYYQKSADRAAYRLIQEKSRGVTNMTSNFRLNATNQFVDLSSMEVKTQSDEFLGTEGASEQGARVLSLNDGLLLATRQGRIYANRKEQLYLAALGLSQARHQWTPLFSGPVRGQYDVQTERAIALIPDPLDPSQPKAVLSDNLVEEHQVSANGGINVSWLLRDIGRITTSFTTDFLRVLTGDPRSLTRSQVGATLVRPLLRNASFKRELENLTQAERDLLYEIRLFTRFRKDFSVQIATSYYSVLGNRDAAKNSYSNLLSSRKNAERTRALAAEGRIAQAELGRLEQQQLSAESAWINALRSYRQSLDDFKLLLGLSVDENIVLLDQELAELHIRHPIIAIPEAIQVALGARLDYLNTQDQFADSVRQVGVAKNFLKPQVDLVANVGINSGAETGKGFPLPDPKRYGWSAGLDADLPFDRLSERNSYRAAMIAHDRASREVLLAEDQIKLEVRESWRTLEQAKRNHEIAELGVKIAERRVEEQNLLADLGRAKAQDQVDAQNALNESRNQRTQALVTHTVTRLRFWNNLGILYIKDNGQWETVNYEKRP